MTEDLRVDGLRKRLGFYPGEGVRFHVAGVTFEGRQALLQMMLPYCRWDQTPPVRLVRSSPEDRERFNDPCAIEVHAGTQKDDLTGVWTYSMIGYVPRRGCATCGANFGAKFLDTGECPKCHSSDSLYVPNRLLDQFDVNNMQCGIDNVIQNQYGRGKLGCIVYVRRR